VFVTAGGGCFGALHPHAHIHAHIHARVHACMASSCFIHAIHSVEWVIGANHTHVGCLPSCRYARLMGALSFVEPSTLVGSDILLDPSLLAMAQGELLKMDKYKASMLCSAKWRETCMKPSLICQMEGNMHESKTPPHSRTCKDILALFMKPLINL
jgi:hypothetical protein